MGTYRGEIKCGYLKVIKKVRKKTKLMRMIILLRKTTNESTGLREDHINSVLRVLENKWNG